MPSPIGEPLWHECIDGNTHDLVAFIDDDMCEYCGMPLQYFWEGYVQALNKTVAEETDEEGTRSEAASSGFVEEMYDGEGEDGGSTQRPEWAYL